MKILKRINNNVVLSSENGSEVILIGKGIGFKAKIGESINATSVEKRYYPEGDLSIDRMLMLMTKATDIEIEVIYKIINLFKEEFKTDFNPNILFTLMDHVLYAIERQKQNLPFANPIQWEIRRIYTKEYALGVKAVEMIRESLYPSFSEEEAASIALHFVNAQLQNDVDQSAYEHMKLINKILKLVRLSIAIDFDENSSYYQRFITHIRFYLIRQSQQIDDKMVNSSMVDLAFKSYPKEKETADKIKAYLYKEKGWIVNDMELMYLVIHIANLAAHSKKN